jgi:LmbE family N-acetylglucosaminyl deacetylase
LTIIKMAEELIERLAPETVFTHHGGDLNVDHMIVHRAVLTATRPLQSMPVRELLAFEVLSSSEWAYQQFDPVFHPNVFVDITNTLAVKTSAFDCYESERRDFPHPRSSKAIQAVANRWGSHAGCDAAEAFELIRSIR